MYLIGLAKKRFKFRNIVLNFLVSLTRLYKTFYPVLCVALTASTTAAGVLTSVCYAFLTSGFFPLSAAME